MKRKRVCECLLMSALPVNDVLAAFFTNQELLRVGLTCVIFHDCFYRKHFNERVIWSGKNFAQLRNKRAVRHLQIHKEEFAMPAGIRSLQTYDQRSDFSGFQHLVKLIKLGEGERHLLLPTSLVVLRCSVKDLPITFPLALRKMHLYSYTPWSVTMHLPDTLRKLTIKCGWGETLNFVLPCELETLNYQCWNHPDWQKLPTNLKRLSLDCRTLATQQIDLPHNLETLVLHTDFDDDPPRGMFPNSLRTLELHKFSRRLWPTVLPQKLEKLVLGYSYKHTLGIGILPENLKVLEFHCEQFTNRMNEYIRTGVISSTTHGKYLNEDFKYVTF